MEGLVFADRVALALPFGVVAYPVLVLLEHGLRETKVEVGLHAGRPRALYDLELDTLEE